MENEEKKDEGKACCGKSSCCCRAFKAVALVVVGGIAGYFAGRHCGSGMCPLKSAMAPAASAPAATPAQTPTK
ncbi:MAG: hypothetical protein ACHQ49_08440 [Elusimicrobiota bacterium]